MLSSIDSLEASFQSIEQAIHRMCGLFGRPESTTTTTTTTATATVFYPISSPPLAGDDSSSTEVRSPLLAAEEDRLSSLARRAQSYAERLESCCQDLQEKYEQVAAIEQKLERSSVIWKVAIQKLTELSSAQRAQLAMLKSANAKATSVSTSLSPPPSLSSTTTTASSSSPGNTTTNTTASGSTSSSTTVTSKGGQKGGSAKKLRRRGSDTLHGRSESISHITCRNSFDGDRKDNFEDESDENLRNALEVMWKVERAKKEACEVLQPPPPTQTSPLDPIVPGKGGAGESGIKMKVRGIKRDNEKGESEEYEDDEDDDDDDGDDIEQVSATILGNVVVLDEIMSEISSYTTGLTPRKGKSKRKGGECAEDGGNGENRNGVAMVDVSVQTDPLAPEQLRSLVDSMVLTPNQDQGCIVQ